ERRDQAHQLFEPDLVSTSVGKRDETNRQTPGCACLRALSDGRLEASRRDTRMATESSRSRSTAGAQPTNWHWRTRDFIVAAALAVPIGLVWSTVWGTVWLTARGITPELGNIFDGFYIVAGVLVGYI